MELISRGKVGDTGDQVPAPTSITRAPCALRVKVRFTLMLRGAFDGDEQHESTNEAAARWRRHGKFSELEGRGAGSRG